MDQKNLLAWIVFLPLLGAVTNGFLFRCAKTRLVCAIATLAVALPFVFSLDIFMSSILLGKVVSVSFFRWISIPTLSGENFDISFSLMVDRLSSLFLLIITGVGTLIHLYSGEYMIHEKRPYRFFVYLNLFIVSMLLLVLGSNMLVTFLGWEGVGVCSYLLIGYWYEKEENGMAAIKAFLVNRIGDAGFLIAMFLCYSLFKSLDYAHISHHLATASPAFFSEHATTLTLIGLSLLLGVTGKSAQIPLYTWLPDAMAGPTPVSALIHAATMVTAGIYLMARTSFLLVESSLVMHVIAVLGAATALLAAAIALAQTDIKKVLAYSTCSQLGYMVLACGVGAFQYGVAHVITHAFFKGCLFLGAGSVIHALHHEQDIRKMGGLVQKMPVTAVTFVIATLAITAFPGFSGFFSKDAILTAALCGPYGHPAFWIVGLATSGLTAFYMWRLTWLVFFGKCRAEDPHHIHENNLFITIPLIVLAVFSVLGGFVALPEMWTGHPDFITHFLSPVLNQAQQTMVHMTGPQPPLGSAFEQGLMGISVILVLVGSLFALFVYRSGPQGGVFYTRFLGGGIYRFLCEKARVDEFYKIILVTPLEKTGDVLYRFVNGFFIEGIVNGVPQTLYTLTSLASDAQSGLARNYIKFMFMGIVVLGLFFFL